jgi:outer membrane biosynthesis protein TonB
VLLASVVTFVAKPYSTPPAEALPIDIISSTEFSQYMAGSKTAPKPSPTPKPLVEKVADAKPVDDPAQKISQKQEIKTASADPQQPLPEIKPDPKPEKKPDPKPEKKPEPPKPDAQKQPDSKPDPIAEALKKDDTKKPPEKKVEEKKAEVKPTPPKPAKEYKFDPKQMAALIDKRAPQRQAATGAELNATASLGLANANAMTLSQNEMDALRAQIQACWNLPVGAQDVKDVVVQVQISLRQDGSLSVDPIVLNRGTGVFQVVAESTLRAVRRCAPYRLPVAKYEVWKEVEIKFDPREMFGG